MCQGGVDSQAPRAILKKQHYSRLDEVSQVHHMQLTETATQTMEFEFDMANFAAEVSLVIPDIHLVSSVFGFHVPVECPLSAVIHLSLMPGAVLQCTCRPVVIYDSNIPSPLFKCQMPERLGSQQSIAQRTAHDRAPSPNCVACALNIETWVDLDQVQGY